MEIQCKPNPIFVSLVQCECHQLLTEYYVNTSKSKTSQVKVFLVFMKGFFPVANGIKSKIHKKGSLIEKMVEKTRFSQKHAVKTIISVELIHTNKIVCSNVFHL